MSFVGAVIGGVSAIGGLLGSRKASKQQKQSDQIYKDQLDFAKTRYNDATTLWNPTIQKYIDSINEGYTPQLESVTNRAVADVSSQFGNLTSQLARNNARLGINPNSGQAQSGARTLAIEEAKARALAANTARDNERRFSIDYNRNNLANAVTQGINQMNSTASSITSAGNNLASSYATQAQNNQTIANNALSGGISKLTEGLIGYYEGNRNKVVE